MRRVLFIFSGVCLVFILAKSAPLAFLVFDTHVAQPGRLPDGWRVKVVRGNPEVGVVSEGQSSVLHLKSRSSSYSLEKGVDIDPDQYPYLAWRWKVTDLPRGGDLRNSSTDDQAAQIIIAFSERRILAYVWDTSAPKDTIQSAGFIPFVHVFEIVCRSGPTEINRWVPEVRNIETDYERAFGHKPKEHVKGIRIQINSQHTGTSAESYFGDVAFRATL